MKNSKYSHLKIIYNRSKLGWYWAPLFVAFWFLLFYIIVLQSYHHLTETLKKQDVVNNPERFIGENAEALLLQLTKIGPRVVGSIANEHTTARFISREISEIKQQARTDLYNIEHEIQVASGNFLLGQLINVYKSIQNVVVKVTPKNSNSNVSLLVNSHFDTVYGSSGAGDDGFMVAVMLETLRVICQMETTFKHSIVFLFNGAEEEGFQGSHAFITKHKWAKNISAFINLDAAGSGGREMLFQTGPNHPWLVKYYGQHAAHYFASTLSEELFQKGLIPSDTDFKIFNRFGKVPGLDFASVLNGYVYHTQYDRFNVIPKNSYQSTGDNLLALIKALANATELERNNLTETSQGQMIFYDVLGWFFIYYTETTGLIINIVVCVLALLTILAYVWNMAHQTGMFRRRIFMKFGILFGIQFATVVAAIVISYCLPFFIDLIGLSLSWYSQKWLIFGLYFCPIFFILGIIPAFYLTHTKEHGLPLGYAIQLLMHSQCVILILVTIILLVLNIRSTFLVMISIAFYTLSVLLNILTCFHNKTFLWLIPHLSCQLLPFLFFTYNCYMFLDILVPMQGRTGIFKNPEFVIAGSTVIFSLLFSTFLVPLFWLFRKSKTILTCFALIFITFLIFAATPLGFPYTEKTATQRYYVQHTLRTFRNGDPRMTINDTDAGFFVVPMDRRASMFDKILETTNFTREKQSYEEKLACGHPVIDGNGEELCKYGIWLPGPAPPKDGWPTLRILGKQRVSYRNILYTLEISGPDHTNIIINPIANSTLLDWSFDKELLLKSKPPYAVHFTYGLQPAPLRFNLELERLNSNWTGPSFEIAVTGHKVHHDKDNTDEFREFLKSFPAWAHVTAWMSSYESWRL